MNDLGPASQLGLPLPTNANATNNANLSVISGGGYITTNNITSNYINRGAPNPEDSVETKIAAALKERYVPDAVHDAQFCSGCMEGTRVELLRDINNWIKDMTAPAILWLTGLAGMGKTAISKTISADAQEVPGIILGGTFFCSRSAGSAGQRDATCIIPTLAQLLALQSIDFAQALASELDRHSEVLRKPIAVQIKHLLQNPLLSRNHPTIPVVFVIDGLDECSGKVTEDGRFDDAESHRIVSDMLEALVDLSRTSPNLPVKFFVASRPETHIRDTPVSDAALNKVLKLQAIDREQVTADIRRYVSARIDRTPLLRARLSSTDIETLVQRCDGLFIFATTALSHTLGKGGDHAPGRLKTLLAQNGMNDEAVKPLDGLYDVILRNSEMLDAPETNGPHGLRKLLAVLLSARMSLSVTGLSKLLRCLEREVREGLSGIHAVVHVPDDDSEVGLRILHASFGDFMLQRAPLHIRIEKSLGHSILTHACLDMMGRGLHFNVSQSSSSYHPNPQMRCDKVSFALEYACLHWIYHVAGTPQVLAVDDFSLRLKLWVNRISGQPQPPTIDQKIKNVFCPRFLFWLEVMSVLGQVRRATAMLMLAASTVQSEQLSQFFFDSSTFVATSQEAIEHSAPHIYLSALPFAAKHSLVYKMFSPLCNGLVAVNLFGVQHHGEHLVMTLAGHKKAVNSISYTPDGDSIGTGSADGTVRIWDMHTGDEALSPLHGDGSPVLSVTFSPDGKSLLSGSEAGILYVWRFMAGHETPQRLSAHDARVNSVAWSPDDSIVASASGDNTLRLWRAETGHWSAETDHWSAETGHWKTEKDYLYTELKGHTKAVNAVAFSPDGSTVASGSDDMTIRLWRSNTGTQAFKLSCGDFGSIRCVCFSPDGKRLAGGSIKGVRLWRTPNWKKIVTLKNLTEEVQSVAISPDGQHLVSRDGKHVRLWTMPRFTSKASSVVLSGHTSTVRAITFSPNGAHIASAAADGKVFIWKVGEDRSTIQIPTRPNGGVTSVVVSSDGASIVSGSNDKSVRVWDRVTGLERFSPLLGHTSGVFAVAASPNERFIASAGNDNTVRLWSSQSGSAIRRTSIKQRAMVQAVAFSSDARWLAWGLSDNTVCSWDIESKTLTAFGPVVCDNPVHSVAFSLDSRVLAAGDEKGYIYLWMTDADQCPRRPLRAGEGTVFCITFLPDGEHIFSGGRDGFCRKFNIVGGDEVLTLDGDSRAVRSVACSSDGQLIGTGGDDTTVCLWDAINGTLLARLSGHTKRVDSVAFTSDGQSIVSGSYDGAIRDFRVKASAAIPPDSNSDPLAILFSATNQEGWRVGPSGELLLWVPAAYRTQLPEPPCTLWIRSQHIQISFGDGGWSRGEKWTSCWRGGF